MATDLAIGDKAKSSRPVFSCNYAQHCLWYETTGSSSSICVNRDTLACQKRCEEVFGAREPNSLKKNAN